MPSIGGLKLTSIQGTVLVQNKHRKSSNSVCIGAP